LATTIYTIGHSTRSAEELIELLKASDVELLVDIRRYPASRRHPQFNREALAVSLQSSGIAYSWLEQLGGRRAPRKDSHNTAWRNVGFRGYADYMETEPFREAVARLMELARARPTAFMCAEQAWQQCHRGLVSDYLKAQGWTVWHILGNGRIEEHPGTAPARFEDGRLSYAGEESEQKGFEF
jgi:uncharacterized protein (DUF488 family)